MNTLISVACSPDYPQLADYKDAATGLYDVDRFYADCGKAKRKFEAVHNAAPDLLAFAKSVALAGGVTDEQVLAAAENVIAKAEGRSA